MKQAHYIQSVFNTVNVFSNILLMLLSKLRYYYYFCFSAIDMKKGKSVAQTRQMKVSGSFIITLISAVVI